MKYGVGFILYVLMLIPVSALSQYELKISGDHLPAVKYKSNLTDSVLVIKEINKLLNQYQSDGYLAASVDSVSFNQHKVNATIVIGERYKWAALSRGNVDERIWNETGRSEKRWVNTKITPESFAGIFKSLLTWYENHGYPFAEIKLVNQNWEGNTLSGQIHIEKNDLITIDSVIVRGNAKLSRIYLQNYINIKNGDVYNESVIRGISIRLKELPMVNETAPFIVSFEGGKAIIILSLANRKASQVDGIIGVLPDDNKKGKIKLSGDLRLKLISAFGRGEQFEINWKQPVANTQDLRTRINYPFLFSTPFGVEGGLAIYKRDTTYIDVNLNAAIQYMLRGNSYLKLFVTNKKTSLLSTSSLVNATVLPSYADMVNTTYGLNLRREKTDYRLNPTSGYIVDITAGAGRKKILKNPNLNIELYNNIKLNTETYQSELSADVFFPIGSRFVLNTGMMAAWMNSKNVFSNEQYRIGGLKTLRGFDEESIYATQYYIGKTEFRYLLDRNSFLQLFYNQAYYASETLKENHYDKPLGFGAGITFETKLGIFSLNYAVGKQFSNPIQFRSAKIHFGIVNYF
ncbi:MAG: BamA/TamA family outer membrane protein [Bacteroidetes bacterium]|nr:BamA/TamA family outer membrane protein [Bacteroidota bacterium]